MPQQDLVVQASGSRVLPCKKPPLSETRHPTAARRHVRSVFGLLAARETRRWRRFSSVALVAPPRLGTRASVRALRGTGRRLASWGGRALRKVEASRDARGAMSAARTTDPRYGASAEWRPIGAGR